MNFQQLVEQMLHEDVVAGGDGSAFGPNTGNTATAFSGDNYAQGDARNPYGIYSGVMSRSGMQKTKRKPKRKKRKKSRK